MPRFNKTEVEEVAQVQEQLQAAEQPQVQPEVAPAQPSVAGVKSEQELTHGTVRYDW